MAHLQVAPYPSGGGAHPSRRKGQAQGCVRARHIGRLTLALSGRPPRLPARGRRKMNDALAARRSAAPHGPLERVVRSHLK